MSVLVNGMKMPSSCGECHFLIYPHDLPVCSVTRQIPTYPLSETLAQALRKRMDWCPLEEVSGCKYWDSESRFCHRDLCATMEANGKDCKDCPADGNEVTE